MHINTTCNAAGRGAPDQRRSRCSARSQCLSPGALVEQNRCSARTARRAGRGQWGLGELQAGPFGPAVERPGFVRHPGDGSRARAANKALRPPCRRCCYGAARLRGCLRLCLRPTPSPPLCRQAGRQAGSRAMYPTINTFDSGNPLHAPYPSTSGAAAAALVSPGPAASQRANGPPPAPPAFPTLQVAINAKFNLTPPVRRRCCTHLKPGSFASAIAWCCSLERRAAATHPTLPRLPSLTGARALATAWRRRRGGAGRRGAAATAGPPCARQPGASGLGDGA